VQRATGPRLLRDSPQPADSNPRPRGHWSSALTTRPPRHMMINSGGRVKSVPPYHTARTKFSWRMARLGAHIEHVRFSNEPPLILNEDTGPSLGTNTSCSPTPPNETQVACSDMSNATNEMRSLLLLRLLVPHSKQPENRRQRARVE